MNDFATNLNLLYFPLTTIIIDDDTEFLKVTTSHLVNAPISTYNSAKDALLQIKPISIQVKNFIEEHFTGIYDLNYKNIKAFVNTSKNDHGIIIADYAMPNMNGIELLSKFYDSDIIKILLTNAYTIEEAVNALNDNIIDYYLPKDKINNIALITDELQTKFFKKITKSILSMLDKSSYKFFYDKNYLKIFTTICNQYKIHKYYILNSYGGYYLENDNHKFIFTIFHKDDLNEIANELPLANKNDVKVGKLIPSYFSEALGEYKLIHAQQEGDYYYCIENMPT